MLGWNVSHPTPAPPLQGRGVASRPEKGAQGSCLTDGERGASPQSFMSFKSLAHNFPRTIKIFAFFVFLDVHPNHPFVQFVQDL